MSWESDDIFLDWDNVTERLNQQSMNNLLIIQKIQTSFFSLSTEKVQHRKGGNVQDQRLQLSARAQTPKTSERCTTESSG